MEFAAPQTEQAKAAGSNRMIPLVVALFFIWGFCTVLVDTLIPKLKALFELSYAEVMLTQFCFFLAYFVVSLPAAKLLSKIGYIRAVVAGLAIIIVGALLFSPAAYLGLYPMFLLALFILASGITILQVAANPLMALLGDPAKAHSRLTIAQAFNSLGTTVGPYVGAVLILGTATVALPDPSSVDLATLTAIRHEQAQAVQAPFLGIAVTLAVIAAVFWALRNRMAVPRSAGPTVARPGLALLSHHPRLALGALSIFVYVGAEVSIGSVLTNYLMQASTLALPDVSAGKMVMFYWGGAMVGRFIGSLALRKWAPGLVLAACAIAACLLASISAVSVGMVAAATVIAIGLANSIMFPTIFTLAIEGLGDETPQGSGLLCMAIVGGAIIPLITGFAADHVGLHLALFVPAVCYLWIAAYGVMSRKAVAVVEDTPIAVA